MKYILPFLILGWLLYPACKHDTIPEPGEPDPGDTIITPIDTLDCTDTIDILLPGLMENGVVKCTITCAEWKSSGNAYVFGANNEHLSIEGKTYFQDIFDKDTFLFVGNRISITVPPKVGMYPAKQVGMFYDNAAACSYSYWDYDVLNVTYHVDTTYVNNFVEITEIDLPGKRVKGRFNIKFNVEKTGDNYHLYPSKLHFFDGEFDVMIVN